jgi:hypothetical protein
MRVDNDSMKVWNVSVVVQAGTYVLGDPCYAVPNEYWDDLLRSCNFFLDSPIGQVTTKDGDEYRVLGFGTMWGDGVYLDQRGAQYPVDAGLIGLVPVGLVDIEEVKAQGLHLVVFDKPVICSRDPETGVLTFGSYRIETNPVEDEDEDEDEAQRIDDASWRA